MLDLMPAQFGGILSCLEESLKPFGDNFASVVFWNLEQRKGVPKEQIVDRPDEFIACLREIFGDGSKLIEEHIKLSLKNRFNLSTPDLADCSTAIRSARKQMVVVRAK